MPSAKKEVFLLGAGLVLLLALIGTAGLAGQPGLEILLTLAAAAALRLVRATDRPS